MGGARTDCNPRAINSSLRGWRGNPRGFEPPARRSVGIFRFQPLAAITKPASVRININIVTAISAGGGKHERVMIGG